MRSRTGLEETDDPTPERSTDDAGDDGDSRDVEAEEVEEDKFEAGTRMAELADAGARRVSVGGSLTWVAVKALVDAAQAIRDSGDFSALATGLPLDDWLPD